MEEHQVTDGKMTRRNRARIASAIAAFAVCVGLFTVGLIILPFIVLLVGGAIAYS